MLFRETEPVKRNAFLQAWPPGYQAMLTHLTRGFGHAPGQGSRENQADPGETGCPYADHTLLPALRRHGLFVDQEIVAG